MLHSKHSTWAQEKLLKLIIKDLNSNDHQVYHQPIASVNEKNMKLLISLPFLSLVIAAPCHICGPQGNNQLDINNYVNGTNCMEITLDVAKKFSANSKDCPTLQRALQKHCCNGGRNNHIIQTRPPRAPPKVTYKGPYKICPLCIHNDYPVDDTHVINFLYLGADTCRNYYIAGRAGRIPTYMCDVVRYFSQAPCGCKQKTVTRALRHKRKENTTKSKSKSSSSSKSKSKSFHNSTKP